MKAWEKNDQRPVKLETMLTACVHNIEQLAMLLNLSILGKASEVPSGNR